VVAGLLGISMVVDLAGVSVVVDLASAMMSLLLSSNKGFSQGLSFSQDLSSSQVPQIFIITDFSNEKNQNIIAQMIPIAPENTKINKRMICYGIM
jgi:hypothetical protein